MWRRHPKRQGFRGSSWGFCPPRVSGDPRRSDIDAVWRGGRADARRRGTVVLNLSPQLKVDDSEGVEARDQKGGTADRVTGGVRRPVYRPLKTGESGGLAATARSTARRRGEDDRRGRARRTRMTWAIRAERGVPPMRSRRKS